MFSLRPFPSFDREQTISNDFASKLMMTEGITHTGRVAAVRPTIGGATVAASSVGMNDATLESVDLGGSGSLHVDEDFFQDMSASHQPNYTPEQSMNLSKLLLSDEDAPSLTHSDHSETEHLYDLDKERNGEPGPKLGQLLAPAALAGGLFAARQVFNRLSGDDPVDEDMPGIQEVMMHDQAGRWAHMQQAMHSSVTTQESTRGGVAFYMQSSQ